MIKLCTKCDTEKPEEDFQRRADTGKLRSECRSCRSADNLRRYHTRPETKEATLRASQRHYLGKLYGITQERYEEMLAEQGGVCAICHGTCFNRLAVDHCHTTGKVRGLLCQACNTSLGQMRDNPELLRRAADYLEVQRD